MKLQEKLHLIVTLTRFAERMVYDENESKEQSQQQDSIRKRGVRLRNVFLECDIIELLIHVLTFNKHNLEETQDVFR